MQAQDVADVILLNTLLALDHDTPTRIARLIDWKNGVDYDDGEVVATVVDKPKPKRGKAAPRAEMDDSVQDDSWPTSVTSGTDDEPDF